MSVSEVKARPWRPWQFSLRGLMLLMFGVALFCGGWTANDWRREMELRRSKEKVRGPFYLPDDVQYFAPGKTNKLSRETMKAYPADQYIDPHESIIKSSNPSLKSEDLSGRTHQ